MGEISKAVNAVGRLRSSKAERVAESDLILLADVVRHVANDTKAGLKDSATSVLDDLGHDAAGLFIVRPGDTPIAVTPSGPHAAIPKALQPAAGRRVLSRGIGADGAHLPTPRQPAAPIPSLQPGRAGWLELLRLMWVTHSPRQAGDTHLDFDAGQHCAMTRKDAALLFSVGAPKFALVEKVLARDSDSMDRVGVCDADGDKCSSKVLLAVGAKWTDAIRDRVFRMRHKDGMTDHAIGDAIGRSHSVVSQQIGSKDAWKHKTGDEKGRKKWRPTPALLSECGLKVAADALQAVASNLAKTAG